MGALVYFSDVWGLVCGHEGSRGVGLVRFVHVSVGHHRATGRGKALFLVVLLVQVDDFGIVLVGVAIVVAGRGLGLVLELVVHRVLEHGVHVYYLLMSSRCLLVVPAVEPV